MAFVFDHLIAILVGATLLGALLFIQQRGQQSAAENTIRHRTETQTSSFLSTLTRDLENTRTSRQITTGLGTWAPDEINSWGNRAFGIHGTATHTEWIELVTLADPNAGISSELQAVGYRTVATGDSVDVGGVSQALYRVDRYVFAPGMSDWEQRGGSIDNVTSIAIQATRLNGTVLTNGRIGDAPATVSVVLTAAEDGVGRKTGDLAATTLTNATRQAVTVRVVNASSTGDAIAVAPPTGPIEIPTFPGINPPPPVTVGPSGPSGPSGPGSPSPGSGTSGGGTSGGNTPPPAGPNLNGLTL